MSLLSTAFLDYWAENLLDPLHLGGGEEFEIQISLRKDMKCSGTTRQCFHCFSFRLESSERGELCRVSRYIRYIARVL